MVLGISRVITIVTTAIGEAEREIRELPQTKITVQVLVLPVPVAPLEGCRKVV